MHFFFTSKTFSIIPPILISRPRNIYRFLLQVINAEQRQSEGFVLTEEGNEVAEKGSHEALVYEAIPPDGILQADVKVQQQLRYIVYML